MDEWHYWFFTVEEREWLREIGERVRNVPIETNARRCSCHGWRADECPNSGVARLMKDRKPTTPPELKPGRGR